MPNPNGNARRCRHADCVKLAAKDGWCKLHRPYRHVNPFRDNFKDINTFENFRERKEFGCVKDKFGSEERWD